MQTGEKKLPGGPLADHYLFEQRVEIGTNKPVGVRDPKGNYYRFGDGEQLVQTQRADSNVRGSFIRIKKDDGGTKDIPFETWVRDYYKG